MSPSSEFREPRGPVPNLTELETIVRDSKRDKIVAHVRLFFLAIMVQSDSRHIEDAYEGLMTHERKKIL